MIKRTGASVIIHYGPIDVIKGKYYWVGEHVPRLEKRKFRTISNAKSFLRQRVRDQLADKKSGQYVKLPPKVRIRSFRRNPTRRM